MAEFVDKVGGEEALLAMSRRRPNLRNEVATAIEEAVAELVAGLAVEQPAWAVAPSFTACSSAVSAPARWVVPRY
ncbi:MAG: hypothetical protein V3V75_03390, partial [Thermoguttaceae bacterium]